MRVLSEQQALQHIDSEQLYDAWLSNKRHVLAHRYGMRWVRSGGHEYLLHGTIFTVTPSHSNPTDFAPLASVAQLFTPAASSIGA